MNKKLRFFILKKNLQNFDKFKKIFVFNKIFLKFRNFKIPFGLLIGFSENFGFREFRKI